MILLLERLDRPYQSRGPFLNRTRPLIWVSACLCCFRIHRSSEHILYYAVWVYHIFIWHFLFYIMWLIYNMRDEHPPTSHSPGADIWWEISCLRVIDWLVTLGNLRPIDPHASDTKWTPNNVLFPGGDLPILAVGLNSSTHTGRQYPNSTIFYLRNIFKIIWEDVLALGGVDKQYSTLYTRHIKTNIIQIWKLCVNILDSPLSQT